MSADRWLTIVLFSFITLVLLVGCFPAKTKEYFENYSYISSWIQAAGSLLAVYATYNIFKKSVEREKKKEDIQARAREIKGEAYLLKNQELRSFLHRILVFSEGYQKKRDELERCIFLSDRFMNWNRTALESEEFELLLDAFGEDILLLQRALVRLSILSSFFHEKIVDIKDAEENNKGEVEIQSLQKQMTIRIEKIDNDVLCIKRICSRLYGFYSLDL